jgi:glutamyl-tRNA reductase
MEGQFKTVSISYKNTPLDVREQIALNEAESKAIMLKMQEVYGIAEAAILSTCNRTEIYYVSDSISALDVTKLLASQKGISSEKILPYVVAIENHDNAVRYLFEVALGLHSQVIGDLQISNQIKTAYQWAADIQMAGPFLHRLMHTIFFVNKRVVQETDFRHGAASTSYATIETIETFLPLLSNPKILVVGLGEVGRDVCLTLADKNYTGIKIANRTKTKAQELANEVGFEVADYQEIEAEIHEADIVISSVRRDEPIITKELLQRNLQNKVKYLIDLSVPRSIAKNVEELAGTVLYDLDEIQQRANEALERRLAAVPSVHTIISEAIAEFSDWSKEMAVSPTIHKLKNALEQIRQEELARYMKIMDEVEFKKIDKITSSMMQKIIKLPVLQLKAACKRGEADTLIDVLNNIFNLETQSEIEK